MFLPQVSQHGFQGGTDLFCLDTQAIRQLIAGECQGGSTVCLSSMHNSSGPEGSGNCGIQTLARTTSAAGLAQHGVYLVHCRRSRLKGSRGVTGGGCVPAKASFFVFFGLVSVWEGLTAWNPTGIDCSSGSGRSQAKFDQMASSLCFPETPSPPSPCQGDCGGTRYGRSTLAAVPCVRFSYSPAPVPAWGSCFCYSCYSLVTSRVHAAREKTVVAWLSSVDRKNTHRGSCQHLGQPFAPSNCSWSPTIVFGKFQQRTGQKEKT